MKCPTDCDDCSRRSSRGRWEPCRRVSSPYAKLFGADGRVCSAKSHERQRGDEEDQRDEKTERVSSCPRHSLQQKNIAQVVLCLGNHVANKVGHANKTIEWLRYYVFAVGLCR